LGNDTERGLNPEKAENRLKPYGPETISKKEGSHPLALFLSQFHQLLVYIPLTAGMVTTSLGL